MIEVNVDVPKFAFVLIPLKNNKADDRTLGMGVGTPVTAKAARPAVVMAGSRI